MDKLFPVNQRAITSLPNMSLLLEVISTPALIIKPRLILVVRTDNLGWYITSKQQGLADACSQLQQDCQQTKCYAWVDPVLHHTLIQLTWWLRKTFSLIHKFRTAWAIEMTPDREEWTDLPVGATTATHTRSGTSVIRRSSVLQRAWAGPTNWS